MLGLKLNHVSKRGHYYLTQSYLNLRDSTHAAKQHESAGPAPPPFDAIVTAEIVALIEDSDSKVYKLSALCKMYRALMEDEKAR